MLKISNRLETMARYVPKGSIVADIGTDHGYLPIYLVAGGSCPRAVAGDINLGPLEAARLNVANNNLTTKIDLRLGNGLQILKPGEVEVICIAGMGGGTIRDVLSESPEVAKAARRLILQPMADEAELRRYLTTTGWYILDEELLMEDGRLYLVIVAEQGNNCQLDPVLLELGPRLVEKNHPLLKELIDRLLLKYNKVLTGLFKSTNHQSIKKAEMIKDKINQIRKVEEKLLN
ncbi:tRNA (adenine(22)-N(1))-methyltransferase [Desulforamulus aquiferis]|uniref:Class I SAM-dependent methyltransferase n=1 Tax=Desulforamulus aquiferis TaxID=1397668 RepID=A0AAW7ZFY7_9FIRM|nr:class I SAM-dependent methyltransferase [Desulforamulus aquiferis]MDO7788313.1 class I SAM-dependent methyltransferase [Desulforamulus aquiferis]RYD04149.1 hypothetical protein N752_16355 [Desulforamulus aquiferis]